MKEKKRRKNEANQSEEEEGKKKCGPLWYSFIRILIEWLALSRLSCCQHHREIVVLWVQSAYVFYHLAVKACTVARVRKGLLSVRVQVDQWCGPLLTKPNSRSNNLLEVGSIFVFSSLLLQLPSLARSKLLSIFCQISIYYHCKPCQTLRHHLGRIWLLPVPKLTSWS